MTLKTLDQILINSEKEIRMSQFKHKPNTGSLFYQEDNTGSPKPNWKGKIVIDDDVLKMLIDDRKTNKDPPILNLAGWQDGNNARINLKTSTWKPEPKADFNSPSKDPNERWQDAKADEIPWD